jgi:hypothetical protein
VREREKTVGQVGQELDLTEAALRYSGRQAEIDEKSTKGKGRRGR